jgi:pimeloyl-ACP methyl ester carboxylesterase
MLDRPGWGLSSAIDYSKHEYKTVVADVLNGALDALGLDRTHLVGASIGDVWALRLGTRHPSRVDRIILLGGGPLVPEISVPPVIRLLASPIGVLHGPPLAEAKDDALATAAGWTRRQPRRRAHPRRVHRLAHSTQPGDRLDAERARHGPRPCERAAFRPGLTFEDAELAAIQQPTLCVYGTADPVGTVDVWRRVVGLLPRGELRLMDGGGHVPWLDDASQVASDVRRFLAP